MRKAQLVLVLLLLAGGVFGLWKLLAQPSAQKQNVTPELSEPQQAPDTSSHGSVQTPTAEPVSETAPVAPIAQAPKREELGPAEAALGHFRVQLVDRTSKDPIAGAQLFYADPSAVSAFRKQLRDNTPYDPEQAIRAVGRVQVSDVEGMVTLPVPEKRWMLFGAAAEHEGRTVVRRRDAEKEEPPQIRLTHLVSMVARVVDAKGVPVPGVPLCIQEVTGEPWMKLSIVGVTQGEQAEVHIPRIDALISGLSSGNGGGLGELSFPFPLEEPPILTLDNADLPEEPVTLVLPPTAPLQVRLLDASGDAYTGKVKLELRLADDETDVFILNGTHPTTSSGEYTFPHVGLGLQLKLVADPAQDLARVTHTGPGPTAEGIAQSLDIHLTQPKTSLSMQLLGDAGMPLSEQVIEVYVHVNSDYIFRGLGNGKRTDAEGRLVVAIEQALDEIEDLKLDLTLAGDKGEATQSMVVPVDLPLTPGINDLGALSFLDLPLVASGRVVDEQGEGVKAELHLQQRVSYGEGPDDFHWNYTNQMDVESSRTGEFELRGTLEPGRYAFVADAEGYEWTPSQEFVIGQRGLLIELQSTGQLVGRLQIPDGLSHNILRVHLLSDDPDRTHFSYIQSEEPSASGRFKFERLQAGHYGIHVKLFGESTSAYVIHSQVEPPPSSKKAPLAELRGLDVPSGGACVDPRLESIPIAVLFKTLELKVEDVDGEPISSGFVLVRPGVEYRWPDEGFLIQNGRAKVHVRDLPVDLYIAANGFRTQELKSVRRSSEVTLLRGLQVAFELEASVLATTGEHTLGLSLVRHEGVAKPQEENVSIPGMVHAIGSGGREEWLSPDGDSAWASEFDTTFNAEGKLWLTLSEPGAYTVQWNRMNASENHVSSESIHGTEPNQQIEIVETLSTQVFRVAPPQVAPPTEEEDL